MIAAISLPTLIHFVNVHYEWISALFWLQALLVLHQLDSIDLWNPDAPIETFWEIRYVSSLL